MTQAGILTLSTLLSILLVSLHVADDIVFKMSPAGLPNLIGVVILTVWLYGALALPERRAGLVIVMLGSLFGLVVPIIHMRGADGMLGGPIGQSSEAFFFVWTMLALGVTSLFSLVLSARALFRRRGSGRQTRAIE